MKPAGFEPDDVRSGYTWAKGEIDPKRLSNPRYFF